MVLISLLQHWGIQVGGYGDNVILWSSKVPIMATILGDLFYMSDKIWADSVSVALCAIYHTRAINFCFANRIEK